MTKHDGITDAELHRRIKNRHIALGGNLRLRIYGSLRCASGKRMKKTNRVFFESEADALSNGFRPCGHCLGKRYKEWKMTNRPINNELPFDGTVLYYGPIIPQQEATNYFERLLDTIEWKNDEAVIFGRHIITKRKAAWYGDKDYSYTYSNTTKRALQWTPELRALREIAEKTTGVSFNSCLLNLYHDGTEGMAWHSDDEKSLALNSVIASMSFGAERKFSLRHKKTKESTTLILEHGSLLVMKDDTQSNWLHALPKSARVKTARINLTFRQMLE